MSDKDLFAPPSNDEMKMFAPPSESELKSTKPEPKTSVLEAAKTFGLEGAAMGLDDELAGVLEAAGQFGGVKGLGAPTLSEIEPDTSNALNLSKLLDTYRSARDRRRAIKEEQRADRPGTALAANIIGGLATGKAIPNPVTQGALAGFGASDADVTQGDVGKAAVDTAMGATIGKVASKAIPYAPTATTIGAGIGATAGGIDALTDEKPSAENIINKVLSGGLIGGGIGAGVGSAGKVIGKAGATLANKIAASTGLQQGFKKGLEGVDITSPEFDENVYSKIKNLTNEVSDPILQQKAAEQDLINQSKMLFEKQKLNTIKGYEKDVNDILKIQDEYKQAAIAKQTSDKQHAFDQLSNLTGKIANEFDTKFSKLENAIGKDIEQVYDLAGTKFDTPINMTDVIESFKSELPETAITPKMTKIFETNNGDTSLKDSKQLRDLFWSLRNNSDSSVRQAARDAYQAYNTKVQNDLNLINPDLGSALQLNNSKYSNLAKIRDNFIDYKAQDESGMHGILKKFVKTEGTPGSTEAAFAKSKSKSELEGLTELLNKVDPELANELTQQGSQLGQTFNKVSSTPSQVSDVNLPQSDELTRLQNLLDNAKSAKFQPPAIDKKFTQFNDDPLNVAQKFMNYLQKGQVDKEGLALKEEMDIFFKDLNDAKGPDFVNNVKDQMSKLSDEYKIYTPEIKVSDVFTKAGVGRTALKSSAVIGNKLGQGAKSVLDSKIGQVGKKTALIGSNISSYLEPQNINRLKTSPDSVSQTLGAMLESIQQMPDAKRNAALFAISQNPIYRNKLNVEEDTR